MHHAPIERTPLAAPVPPDVTGPARPLRVVVPTEARLDLSAVPDAEILEYSHAELLAGLDPEQLDADVFVTFFVDSADSLRPAATRMRRVRLVQSLSAGTDAVAAAGFRPEATIASGVGLHDETVAEHALALMLALVRRLGRLADDQRAHRWDSDFILEQLTGPRARSFTLHGAHVAIWGFGSIGRTLARYLGVLGAEVVGIARTPGTRDGFPVITSGELHGLLPKTDMLVSVLQLSPSTRHAIGRDVFAALSESAFFVNVGRGGVVDQEALIEALHDGTLAGAALDVVEPEPLPADSPLWDAPRLLITPHVAGGRPRGGDELIAANIAALRDGTAIRNRIAR